MLFLSYFLAVIKKRTMENNGLVFSLRLGPSNSFPCKTPVKYRQILRLRKTKKKSRTQKTCRRVLKWLAEMQKRDNVILIILKEFHKKQPRYVATHEVGGDKLHLLAASDLGEASLSGWLKVITSDVLSERNGECRNLTMSPCSGRWP